MNGLQNNRYRYNTSKCLSEKQSNFKNTFFDIESIFDSGSNKNYLIIKGVHALT